MAVFYTKYRIGPMKMEEDKAAGENRTRRCTNSSKEGTMHAGDMQVINLPWPYNRSRAFQSIGRHGCITSPGQQCVHVTGFVPMRTVSGTSQAIRIVKT